MGIVVGNSDGVGVGANVGTSVGERVGTDVGSFDGVDVGISVGASVGDRVGDMEGATDGVKLGTSLGVAVGDREVGGRVGAGEVNAAEGDCVGMDDGRDVGEGVAGVVVNSSMVRPASEVKQMAKRLLKKKY